jgi:Zn finger protein HypA/HybF involved in hydrogenase expression
VTQERREYYIRLIKESESLIEVCRKANIVPTTGNYQTLKQIIKEDNIDISHFKRIGGVSCVKNRSTDEYLKNKYPITAYKLKKRLLKEGYKEHRCEKCENTEWFGKPIPLELHHINGDNSDNRLENLQMLCPNCHAFTDNYGGKNQKMNKIKRFCKICGKELLPNQKIYCSKECRYSKKSDKVEKNTNKNEQTKEENNKKIPLILESLKRTKSFCGTAKEFGVSDNAIRKLLVKRGYPGHIKDLMNIIQ